MTAPKIANANTSSLLLSRQLRRQRQGLPATEYGQFGGRIVNVHEVPDESVAPEAPPVDPGPEAA